MSDFIEHLLERELVQPRETHSVCEPRKLALKRRRPIPFHLRGADNTHYVRRVWRELENIFYESGTVETFSDKRRIVLQCVRSQPTPIHAGVKNWRTREQSPSILLHKNTGRRTDRHHQIRLPFCLA